MIIKYTDILDFHTNDDSVEQLGVGQFLLHSFDVISPIQVNFQFSKFCDTFSYCNI